MLGTRAIISDSATIKNSTSTTLLNFPNLKKNEKALELFIMLFENRLPKGIIWQSLRHLSKGSLTGDSRFYQAFTLKIQ